MSHINSNQGQVVLGTLLGNGQIKKTKAGYVLIMKSSNEDWLQSKVGELVELELSRWQSYGNYYWQSVPRDEFEAFYDLMYQNNHKVITMECLDLLRSIGLAVWYGDVGCLVGGNKSNACLRTQNINNSTALICQYFNEVDLPGKLNNVREKKVFVFTLDGTKRLLKLIAPFIPDCRRHLIPTNFLA